ncbi:sensor histidine kinase [Streptococcus macedonicus]
MSLLKRFGAMVSNSRKNNKKQLNHPKKILQKKRRNLRFKTTLFVQPLTIIIVSFAIILIVFNVLLKLFIAEQAFTAVQNQYDTLDTLYVGDTPETTAEGNIFETTYIIADDSFDIKYISASMYDLSEKKISEKIIDYFSDNDDIEWFDDIDEDDADYSDYQNSLNYLKKVEIDGSAYMIKMQEYPGTLADSYVKQDNNDDSPTYYIFVFANVTPIEELENYINFILLGLMVIIGIIASISIFLTARKLDRNFGSLKSYILGVGNREKNLPTENFAYREFNEVGQTVERMNDMIDANQRSQQLFFQNSSHELRTPLMSIQGYAEGIKEGVIDAKEAASVIVDESQKMTDLVDDILTLSKMESVQTQLQLEKLNITDLLYDVSWRLKAKADERGIAFEHHFDDDYLEIEADEKLLERAFTNILSNAVRYAKTQISISGKLIENQLQITISNDGEAISEQDQEYLFERFYKGKGGHFGIGLAITKEIVERHKGTITVISNAQETSFIIYLPVK